ncbi:MAG TPA: twin transmembrane helix small protein [Pelagibacterium sp.]|uniref:twin transmembrane helix small protein n=1 Tax=Pelagibacterium sp. TaxID=1967288 RepID=UPI002B6290EB|nr:twin transmembrane helix small protein [Pelagibacterium sp.]HWJ88301.1 twin transmembrane helix small protein [Pelagibacterium sp.]
MEVLLNILIFLAIGSVTVILGLGLYTMFKGGSANTSQKLMRARVIMQFVAVALMMLALFVFGPMR